MVTATALPERGHCLPPDGEPRVTLHLPHAQIHVVPMSTESEIFLNIKINRCVSESMEKCVSCWKKTVLTVLNKMFNMNSLIKTSALCCILWQSLSGHSFKSSETSRRLVSNFAVVGFVEAVGTVIWAIRLASAVGKLDWATDLPVCRVGGVCLFRQTKWFKTGPLCLSGEQGFWIKCTYSQQSNTKNTKSSTSLYRWLFNRNVWGSTRNALKITIPVGDHWWWFKQNQMSVLYKQILKHTEL